MDDLNNSDIEEDQLQGIYFWNDTINEWQLYNDTGVNSTYNESGCEGFCWAKIWHLTQLNIGADTETPTKVTGLTVTDAKDGKLSLSWNPATDNVYIDYYKIYRDDLFLKNFYSTSYLDTGLTDGQSYVYNISAVDGVGNEGEKSESAVGTPTTSSSNGGGGTPGGNGGFIPVIPTNNPPISDVNGPYYGFTDISITFDGSKSIDSDGKIVSYDWDFGDGNIGNQVVTNHIYTDPGNFTITLTVTDNGGMKGLDSTFAVISIKPNNPPNKPEIEGVTVGNQKIDYNYTVKAIDIDNDTIRYILDWGDGTNNTISDFLFNGSEFKVNHNWSNAGIYIINVYAEDENNATSENNTITVLIDILFVQNLGYLIDDNCDKVYDIFYCNETGNITIVGLDSNQTYKIDTDGDGKHDYLYNTVTGSLSDIKQDEEKIILPVELLLIIVVILVLLIVLVAIIYKKKKSK